MAHLTEIFIVVSAIVWVAVLAFLVLSLVRPKALAERDADPRFNRRQVAIVSGALVLSAVVLIATGVVEYGSASGLGIPPSSAADTVHIRLIGRQWWWEVQYQQRTPPYRVSTANEMHIPVGRPVLLTLESGDVIHSFWAPNLHGKSDLIPSYSSGFLIQADTPGVYRAPCAEYCGDQHAKMALLVVAQPPDSFASWYANESRAAREPATAAQARGREVFLAAACPFCHTIRGTPSGGTVAPDLTHLASRAMLGAGTIPNGRNELAGWVANSQGVKPGNRMPANLVSGSDLGVLLDYLSTLK
jgi:cytochrome c oxidase subunit II